jgi:uncharacterized membrane protein
MVDKKTPSQTPLSAKKEGNTKALLTYAVGWITGLIFLLTEKDDKFIRFNAAQSVVVFGSLTVISLIPALGQLVSIILMPLSFILWIVLMFKAYNGEKIELPIVADLAKQLESKI